MTSAFTTGNRASASGMVDAEERVRGTIDYVLNLELPGMLHAAVARSDRPHARLRGLDTATARALPGVVAVLTRDDLGASSGLQPYFGPVNPDQPVLAIDRVRYIGEPIAAVVASDPATARRAADLVVAEYEDLPAVFDVQSALALGAPRLHHGQGAPEPGHSFVTVVPVRNDDVNVCNRFELRSGDVEAGFAASDKILEETYRSPAVAHVPMEPHVVVAHFAGGRLNVWSSTQTPYSIQFDLAQMFGLPTSRVRVRVPSIGGGFGAKVYAKIEPLTAVLAYRTRSPVKFELSRPETFITITKHEATITIKSGVRRDGTLVARQVRALFNAGAYSDISPRLITNAGASAPGPYRIPHVAVESLAVFTNHPPAGAFRGFGVTQAAWAYESHMDALAHLIDMDPLEFRRRNVLREGDTYATGERLKGFQLDRVLDDAAEHIDWASGPEQPAEAHRRRGKGLAIIMKATVTPTTSTASVKLDRDGSVHVLASTVEMGQGSRTVLTQFVTDALGIPAEMVHVVDPDTDVTPFDQTTSSSRSTHSMGRALGLALDDLVGQVRQVGGSLLGENPSDMDVGDGRVQKKGEPDVGVSFSELMTRAQAGSLIGHGRYATEGGLNPRTGQGKASVHWHQAAGAAEVEVDLQTGKVTVLRYHSSVFAGRVINPLTSRLQVQGSAIFGLGQVLFEELDFDNGQLTNPNLSEYNIPALSDLPDTLTASILEDLSLNDVHGIGETTLPPVLPAVGNAVARAIGRRIRDVPLTPERVLQALKETS